MARIFSKNPEKVKEDEAVKLVEDKRVEGKNEGLEKQWFINIAYLTGKQWIAWDKSNKKIFEPPKQPGEVRLISNQIMPIVRTELAKITKSKPQLELLPATNDDDDIQAAKGGTNVLSYLWRALDMDEKRFELALWMLSTGTVFLKSYWNPNKKANIKTDKKVIESDIGDVDGGVVSSFDLKYDPTAKKWIEARWCVEEKLRTTGYVLETYDVEVSPEDNLVSTNLLENMLSNINGYLNESNTHKVKDGVIVKEYWELPYKDHPKGRHITVANGKLLQYEDNPHDRLPYECFIHIRVPGRIAGRSVIEDLIPLQKEYNKIISQQMLNRDLTNSHRLLYPKNSIHSDDFINLPASKVEYDANKGKPEWMVPPPEQAYIQNHLDRIINDMQNIAGQHEVSQGQAPPGVKSGIGINFLIEQDDTKLGPTIHSYENSLQKWAVFILDIVEKKYLEERLIKIVGKNNQIESMEFKGSDINGNRDVIVIAGSAMPQSKAARQDFVLNLWDRHIIDDPKTALKLLEFGSIEETFEDVAVDINQSKSENKHFQQGIFDHTVRDFENHIVHIDEHNKFRKTDDYEKLPPDIQKMIDEHVKTHESLIPPMPDQAAKPLSVTLKQNAQGVTEYDVSAQNTDELLNTIQVLNQAIPPSPVITATGLRQGPQPAPNPGGQNPMTSGLDNNGQQSIPSIQGSGG